MSYTPSETRILISFHRQYSREWKDCLTCGIAFQGDGHQCSDCIMMDVEGQAEEEERERLEAERDRLRDELQRYGHAMGYTAIRKAKRRIEEINDIFSPQNQ